MFFVFHSTFQNIVDLIRHVQKPRKKSEAFYERIPLESQICYKSLHKILHLFIHVSEFCEIFYKMLIKSLLPLNDRTKNLKKPWKPRAGGFSSTDGRYYNCRAPVLISRSLHKPRHARKKQKL